MSEKDKTFEYVLKENRVLVSIETVKIKDFIFCHNFDITKCYYISVDKKQQK
mgnify:CR=1 FL=1